MTRLYLRNVPSNVRYCYMNNGVGNEEAEMTVDTFNGYTGRHYFEYRAQPTSDASLRQAKLLGVKVLGNARSLLEYPNGHRVGVFWWYQSWCFVIGDISEYYVDHLHDDEVPTPEVLATVCDLIRIGYGR